MSPRLAAMILLAGFGAAGLVSILILSSFAALAEPMALAALWYLTLAGFLMRPNAPHVLRALGLVGGVAFLTAAATQLLGASFAGYLALAALAALQLAAYEVAAEPTRDSWAILPALLLLGISLARPEASGFVVVGVVALGAAFVALGRIAVRTSPRNAPLFAASAWALFVLALFAVIGSAKNLGS